VEARLAEEATHPLGFRKTYGELLEVQAHRLKKAILGKEAYTPYYLRIH
jgi:CRISPR-associated protein Cas1